MTLLFLKSTQNEQEIFPEKSRMKFNSILNTQEYAELDKLTLTETLSKENGSAELQMKHFFCGHKKREVKKTKPNGIFSIFNIFSNTKNEKESSVIVHDFLRLDLKELDFLLKDQVFKKIFLFNIFKNKNKNDMDKEKLTLLNYLKFYFYRPVFIPVGANPERTTNDKVQTDIMDGFTDFGLTLDINSYIPKIHLIGYSQALFFYDTAIFTKVLMENLFPPVVETQKLKIENKNTLKTKEKDIKNLTPGSALQPDNLSAQNIQDNYNETSNFDGDLKNHDLYEEEKKSEYDEFKEVIKDNFSFLNKENGERQINVSKQCFTFFQICNLICNKDLILKKLKEKFDERLKNSTVGEKIEIPLQMDIRNHQEDELDDFIDSHILAMKLSIEKQIEERGFKNDFFEFFKQRLEDEKKENSINNLLDFNNSKTNNADNEKLVLEESEKFIRKIFEKKSEIDKNTIKPFDPKYPDKMPENSGVVQKFDPKWAFLLLPGFGAYFAFSKDSNNEKDLPSENNDSYAPDNNSAADILPIHPNNLDDEFFEFNNYGNKSE